MTDRTPKEPAASGAPDSRAFFWFLCLSVVVLCVLVVLLVRQNRSLRAQLEEKKRVEASTATSSLAIGEVVEPLELLGSDGRSEPLVFAPGRPATLVLFVARECGYCERTVPIWSRVLRDCRDTLSGAKGPGVRIAGIVADALEQGELAPIDPEIPTYRVKEGSRTWLARVNATPSAVLISPQGKVENMWIGEMSPAQAEEMRGAILTAAAR
ncbi:MAG: hypothetical protein U0573_00640 [Phycisphaerales bacterium]|nr:hypothetical protein [Planctomycetota bacterium]